MHRQAHNDFFAQRDIHHNRVGAIAVDFATQKQKDNKKSLDAKILHIDQDVQRLEEKLMRLQKHHNVLKHIGLDANQVRPAKRQTQTLDTQIVSLQAQITELKASALIHARTIHEQNVRLE